MATDSPRRWRATALLAAGYVVHEVLEVLGYEVFDHLARLLGG